MNKDVLTEAELRGIYYENWREEFQNAAGGVFSAHYIRFGTRPDFEFTRHGTFQYFRWVVANRNAKLAVRPYSGDWSVGTVVDDVESAFENGGRASLRLWRRPTFTSRAKSHSMILNCGLLALKQADI